MEQVTIWNLLMLIPPLVQVIARAITKAKAADPNTLKPAYKTTEFWITVVTSMTGAIGTVAGGQ